VAKAKVLEKEREVVEVVEVVTKVTDRTVRLDLTEEEAQFLSDVLHHVGGNPAKSRRLHEPAISDALAELDIFPGAGDLRGSIYFEDAE